ncbi:hypothetical protein [Lapillicoccus jejuensis]|uniref:Transglycosylase-like protein with SLT domain n=1 Tax=Lapillicoccus jejuensis TaxID=402171 RepID=A0A542E1X0_9MICO|nr:hypothetical protein [Lapillicoccus jejuensis]TQJ09305.1 hypothetical protein FB458_2415 [Lapillicoccus jejuensis]
MAQRHEGRHRQPGRHRAPQTSRRHRLAAATVRRPVLTTAAAVALLGASAAGYAKAGEATGTLTSSGVPSAAVDQTMSEIGSAQRQDDAEHRQSTAAAALKAQADRDAAAKAKAAAAAAAAQQLAAQRQAEAQRAAREAQRQQVLAAAQDDPRSVARMMLADYGWSDGQFSCLNSLWTKESGWQYTATNAGSGAYGIPQSLPASKMGTVASDYRTNPVTQITWGLQYIKASYGTPCSAWAHSQATNWY